MNPFARIILNNPPDLATTPLGDEIGEELQGHALRALGAYMGADGCVEYGRLRGSAKFREVVESARRLHAVELAWLDGRAARLAFWINVYNALVLHAIVALGVKRSVREIWNFFGRVSYQIGGRPWSLDEIEHGILRGNRPRPLPPWRPFGRSDARRALALNPPDPRIHFAITCGARSCPPVGVYRAAAVEAQLDSAARHFVNQQVGLDARGRIACSKIFKWYRRDFESEPGLVQFVLRYLDEGPVKAALAAGAQPCQAFRPYSWALQHPPAD